MCWETQNEKMKYRMGILRALRYLQAVEIGEYYTPVPGIPSLISHEIDGD
jgi:hypothetical protein